MPIDRHLWNVLQVAKSSLVLCMRTDDPLAAQAQVNIQHAAPRLRTFRAPELHPSAHFRLVAAWKRSSVPRAPPLLVFIVLLRRFADSQFVLLYSAIACGHLWSMNTGICCFSDSFRCILILSRSFGLRFFTAVRIPSGTPNRI
jgi:hypothetical protein